MCMYVYIYIRIVLLIYIYIEQNKQYDMGLNSEIIVIWLKDGLCFNVSILGDGQSFTYFLNTCTYVYTNWNDSNDWMEKHKPHMYI